MMAAAPDVGSKLLAWIMAGTGSLLLYSAVKNRKPFDVLRETVGTPIYIASGDDSITGSVAPGTGSEPARLRMLANREIRPDLVRIKPSGMLDRSAAASKARIDAKLGYVVPNVGAYRSFAEQASLYASDPSRFAPPTKSLHVVGLAIDVHQSYMSRSDVVAAFTAEGWHRARWGPGTSNDEEWHWSYGVRG